MPAWILASLGSGYLLAVSYPLAATDLREHRLPNRLVLPGYPIALLGQVLALHAPGGGQPNRLGFALLAAAVSLVLGLLANRSLGLGMGDVKLQGLIALNLAWFEPFGAIYSLLIASALGALIHFRSVAKAIPIGPYLLAGFAIVLVVLLAEPARNAL